VPTVTLDPADRQACLALFGSAPDHPTRQRALVLLLLAQGVPYAAIIAALGCSSATVARWAGRYRAGGGLEALTPRPARPGRLVAWVAVIVGWVLTCRPQQFGFARSRWSCAAVALVLREDHQVHVGREAVRLGLRGAGLVWRRPRPVVRRRDPDRLTKLAALRRLLRELPQDQTAVFMDEVEIHTNPKIGSMWMRKGQQATVGTPGDNEKLVLAGSLHWRTGRLIPTWGGPKEGRTAALFCRHLDDLRRAFRHYKVLHVICDNAFNHRPEKSRLVKAYLAEWGQRVVVHYLPLYAPECNPVEEVWWRLHEAVTRNHRCASMDELIDLTIDWLVERPFFRVRRQVYDSP
jgi:putative transposase